MEDRSREGKPEAQKILAEEATRLIHGQEGLLAAVNDPLAPKQAHFDGKAKSVIWLFINGGPSQVDTFDHKPELARRDGEPLTGFDANTGFFAGAVGGLMKSPFAFR